MATNDYISQELARLRSRFDDFQRTFQPDRQLQRIDDNTDDIRDIKNEIKSLRRALYTFAFSVVASAIIFAATVFAAGFGGNP